MSLPNLNALSCRYATVCSGCAWIDRPYSEQAALKIKSFEEAWQARCPSSPLPAVEYRAIAPGGLRDRADFVIDSRSGQSRLGLFDRDHREIVDIEICPQLSPRLQQWFSEFRALTFKIERGSVRLRISPGGEKGAWLDFANVDVKALLDEQTTLRKLLAMAAVVEIGQRRKQLIEKDGALKLGEPSGRPWFETYVSDQPQPLLTSIGNFTQPGFSANFVLVATVSEMLNGVRPKRAIEFGSGVGNFTLPLAHLSEHVDAFEIDSLASEHLKTALQASGLNEKVTIHVGDFQNLSAKRSVDFSGCDLVFVDPPRSGLKNFLNPLLAPRPGEKLVIKPKHVLYVSCFVDSFTTDAAQLLNHRYVCRNVTLIDQFPQTPHAEIAALFTLM